MNGGRSWLLNNLLTGYVVDLNEQDLNSRFDGRNGVSRLIIDVSRDDAPDRIVNLEAFGSIDYLFNVRVAVRA